MLRRTVGAATALLGALALGAALVLLAGFAHRLVSGDAVGAMGWWGLGLLVLVLVLFGVSGVTLWGADPAEPGERADQGQPVDRKGPVDRGDQEEPGESEGSPEPAGSAGPARPDVAAGSAGPARPSVVAGPAGPPASVAAGGKAAKAEGDWFDGLVFLLVLLGILAGGPFGIAGYEALRPGAAAAPAPPAPDPTASGPSSGAAPPAASPSASPSGAVPVPPPPPGDAAVVWKVPPAGGPYETAPGAWGAGDAVVHVRLDGLFAYAARDGAVRWKLPAPPREGVCAMSPGAGGNIGLVGLGRHRKPCATLLAVHTATGEVLWRRPAGGGGLAPYGLAVGGSTAVAAEDGAVRGRSAETGEERWRRTPDRDCAVLALDADEARALLVEQCGAGARLVALETRTGEERWRRALPVESPAAAAVVSVTPPVVAVDEEDPRGTHALFAFDERGTPGATVPVDGPAGTLLVPEQVAETGQWGRPVVLGGRLIALAAQGSSRAHKVVALSLEDGGTAWEHATEGTFPEALAPEPDGGLGVLTVPDAGLALLDPATGAVRAGKAAKGAGADVSIRPLLVPLAGAHVVVNRVASAPQPAVFGLR
ncbi:outer membrane protein assembly factor BamB family protein [Streptomyces omiyaensis]|uniref:outer membrane protein assembly factor BamB family protein n=1 Tax=Streptomyces omiyaensis TaxID=68247 RepID=UPI003702222E